MNNCSHGPRRSVFTPTRFQLFIDDLLRFCLAFSPYDYYVADLRFFTYLMNILHCLNQWAGLFMSHYMVINAPFSLAFLLLQTINCCDSDNFRFYITNSLNWCTHIGNVFRVMPSNVCRELWNFKGFTSTYLRDSLLFPWHFLTLQTLYKL